MRINKYRFRKATLNVKGFTLIELIIVIAIIAVTSVIIIPNIIDQRRIAKIQNANDGAYAVYVAAQDYLNNLQKRGLPAKDYFGRSETAFPNVNGMTIPEKYRSNIGFLSVNAGVLQVDSVAYKKTGSTSNSGYGRMTTAPEEAKLYSAFKQIFGKRMGKKVQVVYKDELINKGELKAIHPATEHDIYADERYEPNEAYACPEMNDALESVLIEVYPDTYTVRAVYYTTYMTGHSDYTGYLTDDIFIRIYGNHNDIKNTAKYKSNNLGAAGFSSMYDNHDGKYSQERMSKYCGFNKMGDTYAPAYVGQYPLPAY